MGWGFSAWEKEEGESMQGGKREREGEKDREKKTATTTGKGG